MEPEHEAKMSPQLVKPPPRLVVGLGNPGSKYNFTRHNIGFMVLDHLLWTLFPSKENPESFKTKKSLEGMIWEGRTSLSQKIILLKPLTYMNLTGRALAKTMRHYGLNSSQVIVVSDDINLPFGRIRIRKKGSSGGHNGLKSIAETLNSQEYFRIRLGIRNEILESNIANKIQDCITPFVLGNFSKEEKEALPSYCDQAVQEIFRAL